MREWKDFDLFQRKGSRKMSHKLDKKTYNIPYTKGRKNKESRIKNVGKILIMKEEIIRLSMVRMLPNS